MTRRSLPRLSPRLERLPVPPRETPTWVLAIVGAGVVAVVVVFVWAVA